MEFMEFPMGSFRFPQSDPINEIQSGRLFRDLGEIQEIAYKVILTFWGGLINPGLTLHPYHTICLLSCHGWLTKVNISMFNGQEL